MRMWFLSLGDKDFLIYVHKGFERLINKAKGNGIIWVRLGDEYKIKGKFHH